VALIEQREGGSGTHMKSTTLALLIAPALAVVAVVAAGRTRLSTRRPERLVADTSGDPRAAIFVERGCQECHAIAALGVKAATDVGPDLTFAYADVVSRYGVSLPSFLDNPPGLMGFVETSHLHLTRADQDSITRILHEIYQENLAAMDRVIPLLPPGRVRPRVRSDSLRPSATRQ